MSLARQLAALAVGICFAPLALAGVITQHANLGSFDAAIGSASVTVETFTAQAHFPISTGVLNSATNLPGIGLLPGYIQSGATYSTPVGTGSFFNIDAFGGFAGGFLDGFYGGDPNRQLTIAFDSPTQGFAFETNNLMGTQFNLVINFSAGPSVAIAGIPVANSRAMEFFGFTSSLTDITSVVLDGTDNIYAFALDNFRFTTSAGNPAPVPGTLLLLGAGLAALGLRRRG